MANTSKTINNATDQELSDILGRVRSEQNALRLLRELKLKSTPNPNGNYPSYSTLEAFSTETPVSNGKSIKEMTDEELMGFLRRLEAEDELTRSILDIKTMNKPVVESNGMYPSTQTYEGISMNTPIKELYHVGVLGMRWGHKSKRFVGPRLSSDMQNKKHITSIKKEQAGYETGKTATGEGQNIARTLRSKKDQKAMKSQLEVAKNMSDTDLKQKISRMSLEQSYANLSAKSVSSGKTHVQDILSISGSVLAIAASATGLALTIRTLKGG